VAKKKRSAVEPAFMDVKEVAALLGCSERHVKRLADAGEMPEPVKLGRLVRWNRAAVNEWIADGCPLPARRAK
jgi:excisionase family DNA binding protein